MDSSAPRIPPSASVLRPMAGQRVAVAPSRAVCSADHRLTASLVPALGFRLQMPAEELPVCLGTGLGSSIDISCPTHKQQMGQMRCSPAKIVRWFRSLGLWDKNHIQWRVLDVLKSSVYVVFPRTVYFLPGKESLEKTILT